MGITSLRSVIPGWGILPKKKHARLPAAVNKAKKTDRLEQARTVYIFFALPLSGFGMFFLWR